MLSYLEAIADLNLPTALERILLHISLGPSSYVIRVFRKGFACGHT
jgi:hypothetical protein